MYAQDLRKNKASVGLVLGAEVVWRQMFGMSCIAVEFCLWNSGLWCPRFLRCGTVKRTVHYRICYTV